MLQATRYPWGFVTPKDDRCPCLPPNWNTTYVNLPFRACVTTPVDKGMGRALAATDGLDASMNLSEIFPEHP